MTTLRVRSLPGRVAFDAPRGGKRISTTEFVSVKDSLHIQRLLNYWGDIEAEDAQVPQSPVPHVPTAELPT